MSKTESSGSLFGGMAFVIEAKPSKKQVLTLVLQNNGGRVLTKRTLNRYKFQKDTKIYYIVHKSCKDITKTVQEALESNIPPLWSDYVEHAINTSCARSVSRFNIKLQDLGSEERDEPQQTEHPKEGTDGLPPSPYVSPTKGVRNDIDEDHAVETDDEEDYEVRFNPSNDFSWDEFLNTCPISKPPATPPTPSLPPPTTPTARTPSPLPTPTARTLSPPPTPTELSSPKSTPKRPRTRGISNGTCTPFTPRTSSRIKALSFSTPPKNTTKTSTTSAKKKKSTTTTDTATATNTSIDTNTTPKTSTTKMTVRNANTRKATTENTRGDTANAKKDFGTIEDPLRYVIHSLAHDAGVGSEITGRESEFNQLFNFCKACISEKKPGSVYLCGKPGTGKSLTVSTTMNALNVWLKEFRIPHPEFVTINCTLVQEPHQIYRAILEKTKRHYDEDISYSDPKSALEQVIFSDSKTMLFVILDEVDQLLDRNASVLYHLFDWSHMQGSRLVLVGIANTLDLIQRSLPILSKGGKSPTIIPYCPYTISQLVSVVVARVGAAEVFEQSAIELCARKVASIDGDVRKMLNICLDAAKKKQSQSQFSKIGVSDMMQTLNSNYPSQIVDTIKNRPLHFRVVLCAAVVITQGFTRDELLQSYQTVCKIARLQPVTRSDFDDIVQAIAGYSFLEISYKDGKRWLLYFIVDNSKITRSKVERMRVAVTHSDLMECMDESETLQTLKVMLQNHCKSANTTK